MRKKYLVQLLFIIALVPFSACSDWLALEPQDAITRQEYWKTKEQVRAAVFGCYASLLATTEGGQRAIPELMFLWGEMRGDMVTANSGASAAEVEIVNGNILDSNPFVSWRSFYRTINFCNTVIEFAPEVLKLDPTFKKEQLDAYLSEVLTIRALLYFYLVRTFKEVPLKIEATISDEDPYEIAKNTEPEILNQIIADLDRAESTAVLSYPTRAENKGRITRYAIYALKADVYLWNDQYQACIEVCDKIINSGQFGLLSRTNWFSQFSSGNSNESIFELQYDEQRLNPFFDMFNTNRRWLASGLVLEEKYTLDLVNPDNKDVRADGGSLKSDGRIWKYLGWNEDQSRGSGDSYANWIVYRLADILLLKAEALAQTEDGSGVAGTQVLEIINLIRTRANALSGTDMGADATDGLALTNFVLEERARELAFEGKRWFDVLRNAKRNNYQRIDILLTVAVNSAPPDRQQGIINKLKDLNSHYLPIYFTELQTNRQLQQNPFYLR